ncbi:hypothetical protein A3H53_04200 [Candidatus Nomurabacteria bacterium RIFCSPLOWO2_02_FULL_40_10]|uniref:Uncharacterized protein n=2 Tax=Candidatus Nomuraibacteriota TaxID=1752729 RepID=A0A1F6Y0Y9_9BACT|nr:MAG: hypothetical protein A2642_04090 [Candidatus Nomurabacteria bacterium RIFCSPHIGHO2_01_FULL_39_10]OGJ00051.1 MAG: hypothetical protein A3H53_04200 [Candidatus Nomurabacteria bacterium RIFCSPLOWO2_02_FULL_40_10]
MKQGPPQNSPTPESGPKILSFEEFSDRTLDAPSTIPRYNNFFMFFSSGVGKIYRQQKCYKKFLSEHPDKAMSLCDKLQSCNYTSESLKPLDRELYEAYKIMRSYGISDKDLFS